MITISTSGANPYSVDANLATNQRSAVKNDSDEKVPASLQTSATGRVSNGVSISTLAGRLSAAEAATAESIKGMDHRTLGAKAQGNITHILYPLEAAHLAAAAAEVPQPNDAESQRSADAATAFVGKKGAANPFAGLSREQLSTITHDESGTFTINERRAAFTQAYNEEQAWRAQVIAKSIKEYEETGKLTEFFKDSLAHFMDLPKMEQALYPADYASGLSDKIKLDFNYFTHSAGNAPPSAVSLANLNKGSSASSGSNHIAALLQFPAQYQG